MRRPWARALFVLAAAAMFAGPASADEAAFLGTYQLEGRYSNLRRTRASLRVERDGAGLKVTRTGKYTANRWRNTPEFTWTGTGSFASGVLTVAYRVSSTTEGIAGSLTGGTAQTVEHRFTGTYRLTDQSTRLEESVQNDTRRRPEQWWRSLSTKGPKLSSPEPTPEPEPGPDPVVDTGRVKLGGDRATKANGRYTVIVPTDGTLTLTLGAGELTLLAPDGQEVARGAGTLTHEIPHTRPVLGEYTVVVKGQGDSTLRARFVQDGKIDPRIRPWSVHTHFPVYEFSSESSTTQNQNALFRDDGPLMKLDQALGLTGRQSTVWWEKGGDYRTGFGFENGHYTRLSSPNERRAEWSWHADLDGDGVIETGDAAAVTSRMDTSGDGAVDRAEALAANYAGAIRSLWSAYDGNGDGKVDATEIFAGFLTDHDTDRSGHIDEAEWDRGLRRAFDHVLRDRAGPATDKFMKKDADGDGKVSPAELGTPGAVDFQDSSDVDGDKNAFFDRDNISIKVNGTRHFGNRLEERDGKVKLFKGYKKDVLVVEADAAQVTDRETGIADGDLDDSYSVGWWGHCNAWSMASIIFRKPEGDVTHNGVTFDVRDQKGLLVAFGMGDTEDSTFWWLQGGGDDVVPHKYTAGFHRQMHQWLRVNQKGMMADMDLKNPRNSLNFQVWNYPLLGYTATIEEADGDDPYVLDVSSRIDKGSYSDDDSSSSMTVTYRLHFDANGTIREDEGSKTTWTTGPETEREYIRYLIHPFRFTSAGASRNPNVTLARLEQAFGDALKYNRIEDLRAEDAASGGLPTPPGE